MMTFPPPPAALPGVGTYAMTDVSTRLTAIPAAWEAARALVIELLQHLPACVGLYSSDGVCLAASASLARWLGRSAASLTGQPLENIWPGEFAHAQRQHFEEAFALGTTQGVEVFPSLLGDERVRVSRFVWRNAEGAVVGVVEMFEQQPGLSSRAETVGRMALGIAHDFNNALTSILGHADLAEQALSRGQPPAESFSELRSSLDHACQLPKQLLRFARSGPMAAQLVDLNTLAGSLEGLVRPRLRAGVTFRVEPAPGGGWVEGDPTQLTQVLFNLALNGLDALKRGGEVVVRIERIDQTVRVTIHDNGIGMTREVQQRLFEPLFTTRAGGTGLGLCLVRDIVQRHNGRIAWRSEPGKGTAFTLDLPMSASVVTGAPRPRIVVIENDPDLGRLLGLILTRGGYEPQVCANPREARELSGGPVRVVLLDAEVCLPGSEEARRLLAAHPHAAVVVLAASYTQPPSEGRLRVISRPFRATQLLDAVAAALGGETSEAG